MQVSYREALRNIVEHEHSMSDRFDQRRMQTFSLTLRITPSGMVFVSIDGYIYRSIVQICINMMLLFPDKPFKDVIMMNDPSSRPDIIIPRNDWLRVITDGCRNALKNGPIIGQPIQVI